MIGSGLIVAVNIWRPHMCNIKKAPYWEVSYGLLDQRIKAQQEDLEGLTVAQRALYNLTT